MPVPLPRIANLLARAQDTTSLPAALDHLDQNGILGSVRATRETEQPAQDQSNSLDRISVISQALKSNIPLVELENPTGLRPIDGDQTNMYRSFTLGTGTTCFLELHELRESEIQALSKQQVHVRQGVVALKRNIWLGDSLTSTRTTEDARYLSLKQELRVFSHSKLRHHENITKLHFLAIDEASTFPTLGLELAEYGTLETVLSSRRLDEHGNLDLELTLDIAWGLEALHSVGIAHGDLKPSNILVYAHPDRKFIAKLADFSDAVFVQDLVGCTWVPLGGTPSWWAPECLGQAIYDPLRTDVYSFGLCVIAILARGGAEVSGAPVRCFLERLLEHTDGQPSEQRLHQLVDGAKSYSNPRVINMANRWINDHHASPDARAVSIQVALACLNRDPLLRLDIHTIRAIIEVKVPPHRSRIMAQIATWRAEVKALATENSSLLADFDSSAEERLEGLQMFLIVDERFTNTHIFFKRKIFVALNQIASAVENIIFPFVDESFLDTEFNYSQLVNAFVESIQPACPLDMIEHDYRRGLEATFQLAICYINGFGVAMDLEDSTEHCFSWLAIAARGGGGQALQAICMLITGTVAFDVDLSSPMPKRLWLAYGALRGSIRMQEILFAKDQDVYTKIMTILSARGGPLLTSVDPDDLVYKFVQNASRSEEGVNNAFHNTGLGPLHLAVLGGKADLVYMLVEELGADVNQQSLRNPKSTWGFSALCLAAQYSNKSFFTYLLEHGADPNVASIRGATALHEITRFPDSMAAGLVPELLSRGAILDAISEEDFFRGLANPFTHVGLKGSPLRWAAILNRPLLFATLLQSHIDTAQPVPDLDEILTHLSTYFKYQMLSRCLESHNALHRHRQPASLDILDGLLLSAIHNHRQIQLVLVHGALSAQAQEATVKLLFDHGAAPLRCSSADSTEGSGAPWNPISREIMNNCIIYGSLIPLRLFVSVIRDQGHHVGQVLRDPTLFDGRDAIQRSMYSSRTHIFDYLMSLVDDSVLDLTFRTDRGLSALHAAAFCSDDNCYFIIELLRRGLSPHTRSKDGSTPVSRALIFTRNLPAAQLMIESPQCDRVTLRDEVNAEGYTLFGSVAAASLTNHRQIRISTFDFLEQMGLVNFMNHVPSGNTVLHMVAKIWPTTRPDYENFDQLLLDWLLKRMSADDLNRIDEYGFTALHWMVMKSNDRGTAAILRCSSVKRDVTTVATPRSFAPVGLSVLDCAYTRCKADIPKYYRRGGRREVDQFKVRVINIVKMLCEVGMSMTASDAQLDPEQLLASMTGTEVGISWPLEIPADRRGLGPVHQELQPDEPNLISRLHI